MTGYLFLALTVVSEVSGTVFMKLSAGFTKPLYAVFAMLCYICTMTFMTLALKTLNLSLVYAVWSGLGLTIVTLLSLFLFREPLGWQKILFTGMILAGVVGLNLLKSHQ
jgi:small multidrug resistance pump